MSKITIIGAGLAGITVARSLAKRNISSVIFETEDQIATQASGNIAGIIMPHLTAKKNKISEFYDLGLAALRQELEVFRKENLKINGEFCGVLKFPSSKRLKQLYQEIEALDLPGDFAQKLSKKEAETLIGFELKEGGIFFPNGGWLEPASFCKASLKSSSKYTELILGQKIKKILKEKNNWLCLDGNNQEVAAAEIIVIASGSSCLEFEQLKFLPLESVRGQLAHLKTNIQSNRLKHVVCYDGYITPEIAGVHLLGATFNHGDSRQEMDAAQNIDLLQRLEQWLPNFPINKEAIVKSKVGFRTMAKGRLPIIGEIPINSKNNSGLYVSIAHAAKGLLSCNLAGEIIAQEICREQSSLPTEILNAVSPLLWSPC